MSVLDYKNKRSIRVRINQSELLMLDQLISNCKPTSDLSDWHGERQAIHTFAKKIFIPLKKLKKELDKE